MCDTIDVLRARSERLLEKNLKKQKQKLENLNNVNNNVQQQDTNEDIKSELYNKFFKEGGMVGGIISDRGSTFQPHAIKITKTDDIKKYLDYLKSNNKIQKATHNILAYRIIDSKKNITEGFDEDGEDDAGKPLLGILQKLKVVNMMVVVSRWFGGVFLYNDRFRHINDSAKDLILANRPKFEFFEN
jgi:hypothetical protein